MTRQRFIRTLGAILLVLSVLLGEAGCASCSMRNPEQQTDTDSGTHPDRDPSTKEAVTNREEPTESEAEPCDHTYTSSVTPATCTTDGYTIHTCSKCGDGYVDSWVKPVGHTWGEWSVTTPATCYTSGVQTRQCTVCAQSDTATLAQLTHDYVSDGTCEKDGTTYTVYTCANCNHTELAKEAEVPSSVTQDFVYNCDNDFSFTVRFDGSESELRERLTIVESQAEGTQYDKAGAAQVAYTLSKQGDGTWIVKPTGSYENGTRYAARLTDDSASFAEYEGNRLNFTTTRTDDQEVIRLNDDILFLKALEERYPGYYPFETTDPDENGTVYVTVGRADHLKVGDLLCIGDYLNEAEIIEQKADIHSYHIGKISAILPEHGAFILVLEQPEISEVYEELNVSLHIDWDRLGEEMDEEAQAELDNLALNTLLEDDGFVTYLVSMERASAEYLVQRGLTPMWDMELEFSSDFDIGKYFKVSCSAELMSYDKYVDSEYYEEGFWGISSYWLESRGTKVVIVAKAEITGTFPFSNTEGNANGNLIVKASVDCTSGTYMDITYADGKYTIGLIYAWITGETSSRVRIELSVHCDIHYTAEQEDTPFVKNEKTGTYHCAYCRIVEQNKATTTFTPLKAGQMASVVKDNMGELDGKMFCGVCKPQSAILGDYLFVNTNDKCLHIATCPHVTQNAIPITGMASVLENQGYTCCKDCDPKGKQSECIAEKISAKMKAGGMESELKLMKEALKDLVKESGATCSDKSDKKHLVSVELPVAGPIGIYVQFDFVFDFDLDGQAMYVFQCSEVTEFDAEYTCTHWEDWSLKTPEFRLNRCETTTKKVERSDLTLEGTINTRVGGQLGIGVYFGSQKALSFGLYAGAGLYADLNGYLKADFNKHDWWGGARFEAGLYVDAGLEGRLIFYDWEFPFFNWENTKTPLLNLGYDEIWTSFVTTPTEVEIQDLPPSSAYSNQKYRDGYILNPEDFLKINIYDLKQMESSTRTLAFGNHPVYRARIEENSDYFDVVNGIFCVSKDAPAEFVGTFHVVVETTTTWNQYKEGSAVSYLDVYTVSVHYSGTEVGGDPENSEEPGNPEDPELPDDSKYSEGLRYTSNHDGTCTVSGIGSCKDKDVVIPPVSPDGERVTSIGNKAFYECSGLTRIVIPDSVTSIGDSAFEDCYNLTSIVIPDSVTSIGGGAFAYCDSLTSITIPGSVTSIEAYAFSGAGLSSIVIPDSVTSIREYAFYGCTDLTSIVIPDSVTSIGGGAFEYCHGLTSIVIPDSVTSIGYGAFERCNNLISIVIPDSVTSIGSSAFYGCSGLTSIVIPDSVTSIREYAFYGCSSLTSITIPDSVTSIGDHTFQYCTGLTSIVIPDSVTSIGEYAFYDCDGLTSIVIPDSVTDIGWSAFEGCSNLTSIVIPNSVTIIGSCAFADCFGLTSVVISDGVTGIGCGAFAFCSGLTSIVIPDSVTNIGEYAFESCSGLTSVVIPDSVTSIGYGAFAYCSGLTSIVIPDSVTSIGGGAFAYCDSLTSIVIPNSVTSIEDYTSIYISGWPYIGGGVFSGCSSLTSIVIPDSVTRIGDYAFECCSGLTSIVIPDSVTSIGVFAFAGCSGLTSITIPDIVTSIDSCAFADCSGLTNIVIPNSVTSIGSWAFADCSGLTSIVIPDSVTSIGSYAFEYCIGLTSITFNGTKAQWDAISKDEWWDDGTGAYTIHCTDGDISE